MYNDVYCNYTSKKRLEGEYYEKKQKNYFQTYLIILWLITKITKQK